LHLSARNLGVLALAAATFGCADLPASNDVARSQPVFASIDLHTHTNLTDGSHTQAEVLSKALGEFKLDFMANSEHGGLSSKDPDGLAWTVTAKGDSADAANTPNRDAYAAGALPRTLSNTQLWRWQVLRDVSYPLVKTLSATYPTQVVVQGVEWNVPSHEHASVGIVGVSSGKPVADFEFMFDASDKDNSRNGTQTSFNNAAGATSPTTGSVAAEVDLFGNALGKKIKTHADAVAGAAYLQKNFKDTSYVSLNHPSRKQAYSVADLRDLTVSAPDVMVGLEGFPGHQKEACRGGYASVYMTGTVINEAKTARARTYGGADWMLAKVGGLMDSLWAEGRRFWVFGNSDFHAYVADGDFWPGQYAKTWVGAASRSAGDIVKGMKTGNIFIAHGDLVNALDFRVKGFTADGFTRVSAFIGETVDLQKGNTVTVVVRMKSPATNAHGDAVAVDHVDVIAGSLGSKSLPGDANYTKETSDAAVVATLHQADFKVDADGFLAAETTVVLDKSKFIRIRGTNLAIPGADTSADIGTDGNPKMDEPLDATACANTEAKAWADLWFYSNPVFLNAK
jgi:hypothetical protein